MWSLTFQHQTSGCNSTNSSQASSLGHISNVQSTSDFDSGFFSPKLSFNSGSAHSFNSDLFLQRRYESVSVGTFWLLKNRTTQPLFFQGSNLQLPDVATSKAGMKMSIGLLFPSKLQKLLLESHTFIEALLQRLKIQLEKCIRGGKSAFVHRLYLVYLHTFDTIKTFMTTKRLHLTAWHLVSSCHKQYLVEQFIYLKTHLDTKAKKFFLR